MSARNLLVTGLAVGPPLRVDLTGISYRATLAVAAALAYLSVQRHG